MGIADAMFTPAGMDAGVLRSILSNRVTTTRRVDTDAPMTTKPTADEIGRRIKRARRDADLTLKQLSERMTRESGESWTISRISNYEQGARWLGPADAVTLAGFLGVSAAWLLCLDEPDITEEDRQIVDLLRSSDPAVRETLRRLLDAIRRK